MEKKGGEKGQSKKSKGAGNKGGQGKGASAKTAKNAKNSKSAKKSKGSPVDGLLVLRLRQQASEAGLDHADSDTSIRGAHDEQASSVGHSSSSGSGSGAGDSDDLYERRRPVDLVVGRNSRQNDRVTFSVAKASDRWFHARGVSGAHCLLRLDPGQDPTDDETTFAGVGFSF